jgi:hypothetical protein
LAALFQEVAILLFFHASETQASADVIPDKARRCKKLSETADQAVFYGWLAADYIVI